MLQIKIFSGKRPALLHCNKKVSLFQHLKDCKFDFHYVCTCFPKHNTVYMLQNLKTTREVNYLSALKNELFNTPLCQHAILYWLDMYSEINITYLQESVACYQYVSTVKRSVPDPEQSTITHVLKRSYLSLSPLLLIQP